MVAEENTKQVNCFTIGTDPEFVLYKSGRLVSAVGVVNGTKEEPEELDNGSLLQYDNVNLEFATKIAGGMQDFVNKIKSTYIIILNKLPSNYQLGVVSSATFPLSELQTPESQEAGCDPDFNAWTLEKNDAPDLTDNTNVRSCGGHIHVGQRKGYVFLKSAAGKVLTVQVMDAMHGVISTSLDRGMESRRRRDLYGKAGAHRPTSYGVEYRVLSSFWLKNPSMVRLMYSLTHDVLNIIDKDLGEKLLFEIGREKLQAVINDSKGWEAGAIIKENLMAYLSKRSKTLLKKVQNDLMTTERMDLERNWDLSRSF